MSRKIGLGIGLVAVALAVLLWRCTGSGDKATTSKTIERDAKVGTGGSGDADARKPKVDPRTLARGSVAGTVRDDAKAPIAGARVCADTYAEDLPSDEEVDPLCVTTDASGAYVIKELLAARIRITAGAKGFRPEVFREGGPRGKATFALAAGQARTGVDVVLHAGGVELTGTVSDITGGPVANAFVRAGAGMWGGEEGPVVLTDKDGAFVLTVAPGTVRVSATADGYARAMATGRAPGSVQVMLTPESTLSGTVVDGASGAPVPGATVVVDGSAEDWADGGNTGRTDAEGTFRITKLTPSRYQVIARAEHGYGQSEGSLLVGLGQHVDGVVVKLFPAVKITGKVMVAGDKPTTCIEAGVWLRQIENENNVGGDTDEEDGTITFEGVRPGTYNVQVWCKDHQSRDKYAPLVVAGKDMTDLVWEVDAGATVRGKVLTARGEPVVDAQITGRSKGGEARAGMDWVGERSQFDGSYELKGLKSATYELEVHSDIALSPKDDFTVDAVAGKTIEKDLVLEDGGELRGTVTDAEGKPVPDVSINAIGTSGRMFFGGDAPVRTDATGAFVKPALRAGDYRVYATAGMWGRPLRKPGSTDDEKQGEKVVIKTGETTTVKLVVESQSATIKGTVVDADGTPVADAYISSARESDAAGAQASNVDGTRSFGWGDTSQAPKITATDGTFTLDKLSPGKYTLRAYRKGGGEAVAEHVATGTTARLQIKRTGSLEGVAKRAAGAPPTQLLVELSDRKTGFSRTEQFFRTDGRFIIRELPGGSFQLSVSGDGSTKLVDVTLAEGEAKTGVTVTLEQLIDITGRVVDSVTKQPIEGIQVLVQRENTNTGGRSMYGDADLEFISDKDGRFTVRRVPSGLLAIQGFPKDWKTSAYAWFRLNRTVTGSGTVDVGDLPIIKKRLKENEQAGELGIRFKDQAPDTNAADRKFEVSYIEPTGPAANSGLKVGDVIVSVDGVDVTGEGWASAWTLLRAPPGTKLELGLARGATVTVTLKAPT